MDIEQKRMHVPLVDRSSLDPPPVTIAVVGPPGTGKTTLIKSLVKRYTKQSLNEVKGPISVVAGKKRRLTFIECTNDLNAMIDVAKIADLVLLLIDASFGFEMETFEFLNILQVHGFPKIMGVLTHLDKFKDNKKLRKRKKALKQRFWTEIYQGAKLFYLSGVINGKYPKQEILNLSRFISVMKFRPLIWRNTHPYVLADRVEDLTDPELVRTHPKCDRTVSLYGYLRGTNMKQNMKVHIPGAGDYTISSLTALPDPCPLPDKVRKSLSEKHKIIYAPMSDVGGILYDKDAIYIQVPGQFSKKNNVGEDESESEELGEGEKMVIDLQDANETIADRMKGSQMRIFTGSKPVGAAELESDSNDVDRDESGDYDSEAEGGRVWPTEQSEIDDNGRLRRRALFESQIEDTDGSEDEESDEEGESSFDEVGSSLIEEDNQPNEFQDGQVEDGAIAYADSDSDLGDDYNYSHSEGEGEIDGAMRWKTNLTERAAANFLNGQRKVNLMSLVYSGQPLFQPSCNNESTKGSDSVADDDFFTISKLVDNEVTPAVKLDRDISRIYPVQYDLSRWNDENVLESIRNRFITGDVDVVGVKSNDGGSDDEVYGDFEDMETGAKVTSDEATEGLSPEEELAKKKELLKQKFDMEYDGADDEEGEKDKTFYDTLKAQLNAQADTNRAEFENDDEYTKQMVLGFQPGTYVRIVLDDVPCEFVEHFDPTYPVIVGGLLPGEDNFGFLQVRIKKHRWHKKILKTNDPLVFSIGWRRFQSLPLYSLDDGTRNRMLKYTPEHMHCLATFWGPITSPNTGFCAVQSVNEKSANFRISATGTILDINKSTEIVKKLKLTGVPYKIHKNTAFIKDMFTSALEVAKFEGASIRTVSGIRGQVKKHVNKPEGCFRATFEDKILLSDIVFLRAWYPVKPKKLYNPVTSLLLSAKTSWQGMRLVREIRQDNKMIPESNPDSEYKPIERSVRKFNPLKVSKSLQTALPFASKPKLLSKSKRPSLLQRRAVVLEPQERKISSLLQQIRTLKNEKEAKRKEKEKERRKEYVKKREREEEKRSGIDKERKKEFYRKLGQKEKSDMIREEGPKRKRRKVKDD